MVEAHAGSWYSLGAGTDNTVRVLAVYNGELVAGGQFKTAGGIVNNGIARWDGTSWLPIGGGIDGVVLSLVSYNGVLIVGGGFSSAGGIPARNIVEWDGVKWSPLGML